jgi:hypothetical protein
MRDPIYTTNKSFSTSPNMQTNYNNKNAANNNSLNSNSLSSGQPYWFQDLRVLTNLDYAGQFLPEAGMPYVEKVNAIVRLAWYVGVIGGLVNNNYLYLYIPVLTMFITFILYVFRRQTIDNHNNKRNMAKAAATISANGDQQQAAMLAQRQAQLEADQLDPDLADKFADYLESNEYEQPSVDNPFMNAMPFDDRDRGPASVQLGNPIKQMEVETAFDYGTYRDVDDVFNRNNSQRQFFTMPTTTFPGDQTAFANWLYKVPVTCKEGNGAQCVANNHTPLNRSIHNQTLGG